MSIGMAYAYLAVAIVTEIIATGILPATDGFRKLKPSIIAILGYVILLVLLWYVSYADWPGDCLCHLGRHRHGSHPYYRLFCLSAAHHKNRHFCPCFNYGMCGAFKFVWLRNFPSLDQNKKGTGAG